MAKNQGRISKGAFFTVLSCRMHHIKQECRAVLTEDKQPSHLISVNI